MPKYAHSERVTDSSLIYNGPCILYTIHAKTGEAGKYSRVYDGLDASSGTLIDEFVMSDGDNVIMTFGPGRHCTKGLYVACEQLYENVTVVYAPLDKE